MTWNGGSSTSGVVLNSRFLTRLLTSGEEEIERVSMLKEDISSTVCELIMLILSISVTFNVTYFNVTSSITKSWEEHWPVHCCLFYKVGHQQIWGMADWWYILEYVWSQLISVCNSDRIINIGQYLPKVCSNESVQTVAFWGTSVQ